MFAAGEYPVTLAEAAPEVHVSGNIGRDGEDVVDATLGEPTGLYHLILGEGQNAFVANGRGFFSCVMSTNQSQVSVEHHS